jgi:hypothetical protein
MRCVEQAIICSIWTKTSGIFFRKTVKFWILGHFSNIWGRGAARHTQNFEKSRNKSCSSEVSVSIQTTDLINFCVWNFPIYKNDPGIACESWLLHWCFGWVSKTQLVAPTQVELSSILRSHILSFEEWQTSDLFWSSEENFANHISSFSWNLLTSSFIPPGTFLSTLTWK